MNKSILLSMTLLMGTVFGQVNTDVHCDETLLSPIKGPTPYGPRTVMPPDHDLPGDPRPEPVNKGVNLEVWHKAGDNFMVGGMGFLTDGSILELDYNSKIYHITGLNTAAGVTRRELAGFTYTEPLGLLVRNGREVFINTANSVYSYDFDGTNLTQEKEILKTPKKGGWYGWNADFELDGNYLYTELGSRGSIGRYNLTAKTWELDFVTSMRNPHGLGKTDSGQIWFSDNQGNYRPASPIFLMKAGKTYGVPTENGTTGAANWQNTLGPLPDLEPYRNDMVWIPYNGMSQSATDIHFMKSGPFKGQALVGDNRAGQLNRLMLDKVDGQMQGAVIRMTGGLEAGVYRILEDGVGNFYLGGLGNPGNIYWLWCKKQFGFQKLTFKTDYIGNTAFNDVHHVSLVKEGILVEFTSDISDDFLLASNYRTFMFSYIKSVRPYYGGPKADSVGIAIQGVVKRSNREILINIKGLLKESVLGIEFGKNLTVNNNLQSYEMYYTMNHLSNVVPVDIAPQGEKVLDSDFKLSLSGKFLFVHGLRGRASEHLILDVAGKSYPKVDYTNLESAGKINISSLKGGVYLLKIKVGNQSQVKSFAVP